jgi:dTDP-4-dehydrorhamnose reductase
MKILITGSDGIIAREIISRLRNLESISLIPLTQQQLDITFLKDVSRVITSYKPKLIINCESFDSVDLAQTSPTKVISINQKGVLNIAEVCRDQKIPLIHFSSDYIFGGGGITNRQYKEDDQPNPANVYGQSKYEGEESIRDNLREHLIIRTSWLFSSYGDNFVKKFFKLSRTRNEIRMVQDQWGRPTYAGDLSEVVEMLVKKIFSDQEPEWGTYHYTGKDVLSRYDYTLEIVEIMKKVMPMKELTIIPITSSEYPLPAKRPAWSVLDCSKIIKTFGIELKDFRVGLEKVLKSLPA